MRKIFLLSAITLLTINSFSQTIIPSRRVLWSGAGSFETNPIIPNVLNAMALGAHGDGVTDDYGAITNMISSLGGHAGVIYFPPGNYLIKSPLTLPDSVILRGECNDSTLFTFQMTSTGYDCIDAIGINNGAFQNILAGFSKDTNVVTLDSVTGYNIGDWAEIKETNGAWNTVPAAWAVNCVGQLVQITGINGNNLTFQNPLRITYTPSLNPVIRKFTPRVFVGIEDIRIYRNDSLPLSGGYTINFLNAVNCWVKGVESAHAMGAHVTINVSSNISVTGCYFHDASAYDGASTRGYGVMMIQHSGQCLVENNIFNHLRHSIICKQGANGNVAGYNYANNGYRSENIHDFGADIVCHGHYGFANLFEGNIVNNISVDSTWGPTGPYTTFYRNRAALYGILMTPGASVLSDTLNFVGNETTDNAFLHGLYSLAGINHFEYGNNILGTITPAGTTNLTDTSYYRTSFSDFWSTSPFPPTVGEPIPLGTGTNPAMARSTSGGRLTVSPSPPCNTVGISTINSNEDISIYPNPASISFFIRINNNTSTNLEIIDVKGRLMHSENIPQGVSLTEINTSTLRNGIYFVRLITDKQVLVRKLAIDN